MRKLIIQIPCFNEEESLSLTLKDLPKNLPGIDCVEWLIINDGSVDSTVEVAKAHGVDHIVDFTYNHGLAKAFMAGIEASLLAGADIIVNTDADNQYYAGDISTLIAPILAGHAEFVVGARPIDKIKSFSRVKKVLQKLGSWVVQIASQTNIPDATSGFRAFTRNAAMQLNVFDKYTYTLETIIQAGQDGIAITSVPIRTNQYTRPSRLVKSNSAYIKKSILTIFRIFMAYRPLQFFTVLGSVPLSLGLSLWGRWLILIAQDPSRTRAPSLIVSSVVILAGFQLILFGLVADLMAVNRKILEDIQLRQRRNEYGSGNMDDSKSG